MSDPRPKKYEKWFDLFERFVPVLTVGGFLVGILVGEASERFTGLINSGVACFIDLYAYIAPLAIFLILAPSLGRTFRTQANSRFVLHFTWWYFLSKVLACVWGALFTCALFRLPLLPRGAGSIGAAMAQSVASLGQMMLTSWYFWAMYAAIAVAVLSRKHEAIGKPLEKILDAIEISGRYFIPLIPIFMVAIGTYVQGLPRHLCEQFHIETNMASLLRPFSVWGIPFDPGTSWGMIWIYVFGSFLVGLGCFIWHSGLLAITRFRVKRFSIREYFLRYWVKVYPLLWATSSESIATPLNLYLVKRYAPWVRTIVRRFAVGVGSYMNINGTLICVFVLGGMVFSLLGIQTSLLEWLLAVPVVVLISYGVPGIPGELVLFAGPIATLMSLPAAIQPFFIAIYVGLQIGLPDSFRTGSNSTDNYVSAILLNEIYEKSYAVPSEEEAEDERPEVAGAAMGQ